MKDQHPYSVSIQWPSISGDATRNYSAYSRNHTLIDQAKTMGIPMSADPSFRGDSERYNPEELLVGSLASCHMLWYLHLCAVQGVVVTAYSDNAEGVMTTEKDGSGKFESVTLKPQVTVAEERMIEKAMALHQKAQEMCFIANSVNFEIIHKPIITISPAGN